MDVKRKVAAYCRVSTDKQDQINSLAGQIHYFTALISSHPDWQMSEIYFDEGISGTSIKRRAGFNRMIQDAALGKMDLILTKEVSRFARNTVDTLSYTRKLKTMGIGVLFLTDHIDTMDSDGELRLSIMACIAQEESRRTSERVKWGQKRRMEEGVVFGHDMLGYSVKNGRLLIIPQEAETVRLIYHKYLQEGKGTNVIARELDEAGIRPKRAKKWTNTIILRVLRNEKYVGDLCQKKTYTPDYLSHSKKYNRGQEEMVYLKDHHEAIIDRVTWEMTQAELKRRSPTDEQKRKYSNRYWCSGKLVCGECGRRFVSRSKKLKGGGIHRAWRCYSAASHGIAKTDSLSNCTRCNSASVNDRVLRACVGYVMRHVQIEKDAVIRAMLAEIKNALHKENNDDPTPLYAKMEALDDKKRRAIDLALEGEITHEDLRKQTAYYNEEIESLFRQITDVENAKAIRLQQRNDMRCFTDEISRMMDNGIETELLYREVLDKIVICNNNRVNVYLNCMPSGIELHYRVSGRKDGYRVEIDDMASNIVV